MGAHHQPGAGEDVAVRRRPEIQQPRMYRVLLHNDHYTTMDFVVGILVEVFNRTSHDARRIMLEVHENGIGLCGVYPSDVAEMKVSTVHKRARKSGFPLLCTMTPE